MDNVVYNHHKLHCVSLFATPWTIDHHHCRPPLSMGFSRQAYWSGLPFPSAGTLPNPGIEPGSPALSGEFFTTEALGEPRTLNENKPKLQAQPQVPPCLCVRAPCGSKSWRMDFQGRISWGELNCGAAASNGGIRGLLTSSSAQLAGTLLHTVSRGPRRTEAPLS